MIILCSKDEEVWRAGMTSQQEYLNRHLINVSRMNTWTVSTEGLPEKIHVSGISKCPVMETSKSHTSLSINCAQNTAGKCHKEMNIYDLCSGSIHSDSRRDKIT